MSFSQLKLHERVLKAVEDTGYTEPTPIQAAAIPPILKGRDLIGIAQTGTGKTAAFVLPLLSSMCTKTGADEERFTRVLILAPTRELVSQICQSIRTYAKYTNLRTLIVTGRSGEAHQIKGLESGVDIVIATPGRLEDLQKRNFTRFDHLEYLVLDEADRMLDMGFLPAIERLVKPLPKKRQTLLFSATFEKQVVKLANNFLQRPEMVEVGDRTSPADTVSQCVYLVERKLRAELLIHLLEDHHLFAVMVFVRTRQGAEELFERLKREKISAVAIHGDKTQNHRTRALKDFKSSKIRVLVATDVAARGLDIQGVTHVINYDFPEHNEDYIHRIGRTGRAGSDGEALTFVTENDHEKRVSLEKHIKRTLAQKRPEGFDCGETRAKHIPGKKSAAKGKGKGEGRGKDKRTAAKSKPYRGKKEATRGGSDSRKSGTKSRGKFAPKRASKAPTKHRKK